MKTTLATLAVAAWLPLSAIGATIIEYNANTGSTAQNPGVQGWTESIGSGSPAPEGAGTETIGGTDWRYWSISNAGSTFSATYRFNLAAGDFNDPEGWTATAKVRVESAYESLTATYLQVRDGESQWQILLTRDTTQSQISYWGVDTDPNQRRKVLANYDLAADYIILQLHYDPATEQVGVYVNGVAIGSPLSRAEVPEVSQTFISFGDSDNSPRAVRTYTYWNQVSFETGYAVIPEPGLSGLMFGGAAALFLLAQSRRRA
ncbi:MAG TPA: hypothetical protein VNQ90_08505 [Chthoniobacteraceae bacterium]|nr:hypothetical protein [Chthoniobacteraceae bacterium]